MLIKVYVLIDPRTSEIRYVGVTKGSLDYRLKKHIQNRVNPSPCKRYYWIEKIKRMGLSPRIELIQEMEVNAYSDIEPYWIKYFNSLGCNLVNSTSGGEGLPGWKHTEESKQKIKDSAIRQFQDPAQRAAVSRVHKGKIISDDHKSKVGKSSTRKWKDWRTFGKSATLETRRKISLAKLGVKVHTPSSKAKMSAARKGVRKSPEHIAKIRASNLRTYAKLLGREACPSTN